MAIITQDYQDEQCRSKNIKRFSKELQVAQLLQQSNIRKAKGIGVLTVFVQLLGVVFTGKPLSKLMSSGITEGAKDVYYRFMNNICANWMKLIRLLSSSALTF
jgi:hypothetical protein